MTSQDSRLGAICSGALRAGALLGLPPRTRHRSNFLPRTHPTICRPPSTTLPFSGPSSSRRLIDQRFYPQFSFSMATSLEPSKARQRRHRLPRACKGTLLLHLMPRLLTFATSETSSRKETAIEQDVQTTRRQTRSAEKKEDVSYAPNYIIAKWANIICDSLQFELFTPESEGELETSKPTYRPNRKRSAPVSRILL